MGAAQATSPTYGGPLTEVVRGREMGRHAQALKGSTPGERVMQLPAATPTDMSAGDKWSRRGLEEGQALSCRSIGGCWAADLEGGGVAKGEPV
jgi:hypothetical protein